MSNSPSCEEQIVPVSLFKAAKPKAFRVVHINSIVDCVHHLGFSNAGGVGTHQFTPAFDTEYLFYGHTWSSYINSVTKERVSYSPNLPEMPFSLG